MALIFTADDYGAYKEIDDGVIDALENGWLNSVAMLANGFDMKLSVSKILPFQKDKRVDLGCHFTMNSGEALSTEMRNNPHFTHHGHFRPFFNMNIGRILQKDNLPQNMYDLKAELRAQIDRLRDLGIDVKHLSSHFNVLHFYPDFLKVQFEVLAEENYQNIKIRSTYVTPKFSRYLLPGIAKISTLFQGEIDQTSKEGRIKYEDSWTEYMIAIGNWCTNYKKEFPVPAMPDILDGFHYQAVGSLGIGRSTKKRKARKKGEQILEKVFEVSGKGGKQEFLFHLADNDFLNKEARTWSKKRITNHLNNKYSGVTPKYMDNRHVEFQSLAFFNSISNLELDPQPWSKI
ncbi:MAG: ChbG/HpnK family deacetylase [Crocinitomicaceae bacterium]